jgi:tetraacyldisaccharide 4'-kinase
MGLARRLEEGAWDGPVARALSRAWGAVAGRQLARPLSWPDGVRVIAIGGATLGGSGKTPLAIACARALAERGARVAFVAHGYRARPGGGRVVRGDDDVAEVGDEALVAARALADRVPVVVAASRQDAVDRACRHADVLVIDGVLQTTPRRASLALLALDGASPWGAGAVPPSGDLRAPRAALLAACDHAVALQEGPPAPAGVLLARVRARGAHAAGVLLPWSELAGLRVGLFFALARPVRLLASLARRGVHPVRVAFAPDHGPVPAELAAIFARPGVDLWLATAKCGAHLGAAGLPHAVLEHQVALEPPLLGALLTSARCLHAPRLAATLLDPPRARPLL